MDTVVVMVLQKYKYMKTYQIVHFQYVQLNMCQLYFKFLSTNI